MGLMQGLEMGAERIMADPILFGPTLFVFAWLAWGHFTQKSMVPSDLPWIKKKSGFTLFEDLRLRLEGFSNVREWLADGYSNYSLKGKSYIYRTIVGTPEVIIPRSQLQWLLDYSDKHMSVSEVHYDMLAAKWTMTDPAISRSCFKEHVIHRNLARKVVPLIMDIWDEVQRSIDDTWGYDSHEWKELCVYDNLLELIPRISNRLFLGLPLCRNKEMMDDMCHFADDVFRASAILNLIPGFLKEILGPLVCIPNRKHWRNTTKFTLPMIEGRLANMEKKAKDPSWKWEAPNDYITWHIEQAKRDNIPEELDPIRISRHIMGLNFASIHTTTFATTNALFDIFSSDPSKGYLEGIREEIERVFEEEGGVWNKQSLSRLVRTDSAIRESLRLRSFLTRGVKRKCMLPQGAVNKSEGWTAPHGAVLAVDAHSIHHDPELYPNPYEFDAFRFSRARELIDAGKGREAGLEDVLKSKNLSAVTTSDSFLPWGHGIHACPGRFFVLHEMKMMFAHMLMNYEIEPLKQRPDNVWIGYNVMPPMKATIRVKRRVGTVPN